MKGVRRFTWLIALVVMFCGCGRKSADELFSKGQAAASDSSTFAEAEKNLRAFLDLYPKDERCDDALMHLATIAQNKGEGQKAIFLYEELLEKYPESDRGYQAQFMIGYIYEEMLGDYEKAKSAYQRVIENYPHSDLADDAKISIEHIGMSPEEWINFEGSKDTVQTK